MQVQVQVQIQFQFQLQTPAKPFQIGHSDVKTTLDIYAHVTLSARENAIEGFEEYLYS